MIGSDRLQRANNYNMTSSIVIAEIASLIHISSIERNETRLNIISKTIHFEFPLILQVVRIVMNHSVFILANLIQRLESAFYLAPVVITITVGFYLCVRDLTTAYFLDTFHLISIINQSIIRLKLHGNQLPSVTNYLLTL